MLKKNPFSTEDYLEVWLESDPKLQLKNKQAFRKFKQNYLGKKSAISNLIMTIQNSLKTLHISSTFIAFSLAIGITLFGLIGGAQTFASNEYKPSTLLQNVFGTNKQKERDPNQKLVADSTNGLVELNDCNLRIKYPKQYLSVEVTVNIVKKESEDNFVKYLKDNATRFYKENSVLVGEPKYLIDEANKRSDLWQDLKNKGVTSAIQSLSLDSKSLKPANSDVDYTNLFGVNCYQTGKANTKDITKYLRGGLDNKYKITSSELQKLTGWFITDKDLGDIFLETGFLSENGIAMRTVIFTYKNLTYEISGLSSMTKIKFPAITGEDASKQYENLVKNEGDPFDIKNKFGHDIQVQFID